MGNSTTPEYKHILTYRVPTNPVRYRVIVHHALNSKAYCGTVSWSTSIRSYMFVTSTFLVLSLEVMKEIVDFMTSLEPPKE